MHLSKQIIALLLLLGYLSPSFAAVDDVSIISCSVYNDNEAEKDDKNDGKEDGKKESEPDCE